MADTDARTRKDEHFTEEDWVDFVREQAPPARRAALQQHLDGGCPRCTRTVRVWRDVLGAAQQESASRPPDALVRQIRGTFALRRPPRLRETVAARVALVFDSLLQPSRAGVRSAGPSPRHLLYKAGRYTIKLRVEPTEAERMTIAGQILDDHQPPAAVQDIAVLVLRGGKTLDRTLTNQLGEFVLEPDAAGNLRLCVGVAEIGTFTVQAEDEAETVLRTTGTRALGASGRRTRLRQR
jgi:hypothetical protein